MCRSREKTLVTAVSLSCFTDRNRVVKEEAVSLGGGFHGQELVWNLAQGAGFFHGGGRRNRRRRPRLSVSAQARNGSPSGNESPDHAGAIGPRQVSLQPRRLRRLPLPA